MPDFLPTDIVTCVRDDRRAIEINYHIVIKLSQDRGNVACSESLEYILDDRYIISFVGHNSQDIPRIVMGKMV